MRNCVIRFIGIFRPLTALLLLLAAAFATPLALAEGSVPTGTRVLAPTTGTINNLVVFIRFSDQPEFSQPLAYYDGLFNSATNSLKNFYLENSYNAVTVNSTFYPTVGGTLVSYQDSHPTAYYQPFNASTNPLGYQGAESTTREAALVSSALAAISGQIPGGLNLDSDNDGFVDHITFEVYSSAANPLPVLFYSRATYDSTGTLAIGGKSVGAYTWVSAQQDTPNSGTTLAATEIHEMGHSFGYPDLRANNGRQPVGDWDVMATTRVVHSGAYMKYRFTHWIADIPEISANTTYTLNDLTQATNNSYKIQIPGSSEFLILEYRKAAGVFESNLFGSGLCVTRVNENAGIWGNLGGPPFFLYYFRQNGTLTNDGTGNAWSACFSAESGRVQFNDHSNPACFLSDGTACGISIANIGSAAGSSISFALTDPASVVVTHRITGILSQGGSRVSGATVSLSGDATATATTDNLGNYNLVVNNGGSYTVTPSKANLSFSPVSQAFNNVTVDQNQNFTATYNTNTITGAVSWGTAPMADITVACNSGCTPQLATTDANGAYSFTVNAGGTYDVYLTGLTGYYVSPGSKTFSAITSNQTQNFSLQAISATALTSSANPAASGQSLTLTATVSGGSPTGTVTFSNSGSALCTAVTLSNAQAQCVTSSLAVGSRSISASYSGDSRTSSSTSNTLTQVITQASVTPTPPPPTPPTPTPPAPTPASQTIGTVSFTPGSLTVGSTATVAATASSGLAVSFASSTTSICTVTGSTVTGISAGTCTIVASQVGNASYAAATAVSQNLVVTAVVVPPASNTTPPASNTTPPASNTGGSQSNTGSASITLTPVAHANLSLPATIPDLKQVQPTLNGATLLSAVSSVIAHATGLGINAPVQNDSGVLNLPYDGGRFIALPVGEVQVDMTRADGMETSGNKTLITSNGLVTTIVPSVSDFTDFSHQLSAFSATSTAIIQSDGTIRASINGTTYLVQPGWIAIPGSAAAGFTTSTDGFIDYVDAAGNQQVLYPAFADLSQVLTTFHTLDANLTINAIGNGDFSATFGGKNLTLVPDYALVPLPADHANDAWWQTANGKIFIRYSDGKAQGFSVK